MRDRSRIIVTLAACFVLGAAAGCPSDDGDDMAEGEEGSEADPFFPADYESTFTEVRDCRGSGDHDLHNIRILAGPDALAPYQDRMESFPEGSLVLKVEHDFGDTTCEGEILQYTVMRRLAEGSSPDTLDWEWQQVSPEREVLAEDLPRCIGCHTGCGVEPDGYQGTCAMP